MQAASAEPALPTGHLLPASWALHAPDTRALLRCVLLAVLLHIWLVLLLGNAPGGTARDGQGVWGAINVTLSGGDKRPTLQQPTPAPEPPAPGPVGTAQTPRVGGVVRDSAPPADSAPGAAQLGTWTTDVAPAAAPEVPLPAPSAGAAVQALPPVPALEPPLVERTLALRPQPAATRAPADAAALPALPPVAPVAPVAVPALGSSLPELAAPPIALRQLPAAQAAAAPLRPAVAPLPLTAPAAPVERLPDTPALVAAPLAAPAPAAPPRPALAAPTPPDTQAIPRLNPVAAPKLPDLPVLPAAGGVAESPGAPAPASASARTPAPAPSTTTPPANGPVGLTGAPDAGPRIGQDVATPPTLPASAPPRLNLDLPRARGGELSRGGSAGMLPLLPRPPELPDKLAKDIERAARDDCRTAYSGAGLLAVVPLVADAFKKQGGCKW